MSVMMATVATPLPARMKVVNVVGNLGLERCLRYRGTYSRTELWTECLLTDGIGRSNVMVTQAANDS